jgi:hypothetical protein
MKRNQCDKITQEPAAEQLSQNIARLIASVACGSPHIQRAQTFKNFVIKRRHQYATRHQITLCYCAKSSGRDSCERARQYLL